jgi:Tol biopolymer transport system component
MPLTPGTQLGSYEIVGLLGAGGMGEVYRARDTRLSRDVAVKTLPDSVTRDPERLARFRREAQVLAALNHQHIAGIYGLEEANSHRFLVLELVDGETLAARIERGPLPVEEAIPIAKEIAEALESAHERGIVHRDLKPANIALTSADRVKVLDFGLAKAADVSGSIDSISALNLPTITSPAMLTQVGMILGTAAYMSPEQSRGRAADKRSDVWAFGCVLFEMLTGRRAFDGDDVSETLAAVLKSDPSWDALPPSLPAPIRTLLKGCLEKNPRERISDMSTVLFVLKQDASRGVDVGSRAHISAVKRVWPLAAVAIVSLAIGAAAVVAFWPRASVRDVQIVRFALPMTDGRELTMQRRAMAVSPDGSRIAYSADNRIFVRPVAEDDARPVAGADPGLTPAFSPDGQSIVFWGGGTLKRISITGGVPVTICAARVPASLDWDASGIVFERRDTGILRVSPDGGTPETLVRLTDKDGAAQGAQLLPDGDTVLFSLGRFDALDSNVWEGSIFVQSIKTGTRTKIIESGTFPRYLPTGQIVYMFEGTLMVVPFDAAHHQVTGGAGPVVEGVNRGGSAQYAVSDSGVLAYIPGSAGAGQENVFLYDRKGTVTPLPLPRGFYSNPRVSPDGNWLAVQTYNGKEAAISRYELSGASAIRRLTYGGNNRMPVWSRDGTRVAFQSDREGDQGIWWQSVDGGAPERLTRAEPGTAHTPESWSPIEDVLLYSVTKDLETTLWALSPRDRKPSRFDDVISVNVPTDAVFSPDGHWIAYQVGERSGFGDATLYVRPFPPTRTKYEIVHGGRPAWAPDGRELFFVPAPTQFVAVSVQTHPAFAFTNPIKVPRRFGLASPGSPRPYDILPDHRFVTVGVAGQTGELESPHIQVVVNWFEELKRKQPASK